MAPCAIVNFGPRPLTGRRGLHLASHGSACNGQVGYRFDNGWRIQLDAFNMLDSKSDQITYAYGSLLKTDSLFAACFPAGGGAPTAPAAVCQTGIMEAIRN